MSGLKSDGGVLGGFFSSSLVSTVVKLNSFVRKESVSLARGLLVSYE